MTDNKLNLETIGRREPYRVPAGYFDTLTDRVVARAEGARVARRRRIFAGISSAVAAAAVVILLVVWPQSSPIEAPEHIDFEQYFANLSLEDQQEYLNIHQDDIFLTLNQ